MKLSIAYLSTLVAVTTAASVPATCQSITDSLGDKPQNLLQYFQQTVCQKNKCSSTINDQNEFVENTVIPDMLKQMSSQLDIKPDQQQKLQQLGTQAKQAITKNCGSKGDQKLCDDEQGVKEYGQCVIDATGPIFEDAGNDQGNQPSEEDCQKLKKALTSEELWSKTLPGYVDQFAQQCQKN